MGDDTLVHNLAKPWAAMGLPIRDKMGIVF